MRPPVEIWTQVIEHCIYEPDIFEPSPHLEGSLAPRGLLYVAEHWTGNGWCRN